MNTLAIILPAVCLSYLVGSVPTGLWLGLWLRKVDIRAHGSRNIGATNTLRVLGKRLGAAALAGDILKGALPVLLAARLDAWEHLPLACGIAAILGHSFPIFLRFRGGKGVATSTGVFLALAPYPFMIAAAVFFVVVSLSRMVSAGSVAAALAMAIAVMLLPATMPVRIAALLVAALVVYKHRENIQRILNGTENRISFKNTQR